MEKNERWASSDGHEKPAFELKLKDSVFVLIILEFFIQMKLVEHAVGNWCQHHAQGGHENKADEDAEDGEKELASQGLRQGR